MAGRGRLGGMALPGLTVVLACWLALTAALGLTPIQNGRPAAAQESDARLRLVHGLAEAGAIDVYIGDSLAMIGIVFGEVSGALVLPAGEHDFSIVPTGAAPDAALAAGAITLRGGAEYFGALLGSPEAASVGLFAIDARPLEPGRARFRVISGVPDVEQIVPVFTGGDALSEPLGFGDASEYATIDAGTYDLDMIATASGASLLPVPGTALAEGTTTDIVLVGLAANGTLSALIETVPVEVSRPTGLFATIAAGTCEEGGALVADLGVVQPGRGETVGVPNVAPVAQGFGLVPVAFGTLVSAPHAVVIEADGDSGDQISCGEIGGQLTDTGALVVAMRTSESEAVSGVAVLAPGLENPDTTGVSIFLAEAN